MRLCFGTFANILLENRSNEAVNKFLVGKSLVEFIQPSFSYDTSLIYKVMDRTRNLPADLAREVLDTQDLCNKFQFYAAQYLNLDYSRVFLDFFNLILSDETLPSSVKADLVMRNQQKSINIPQFLAEVFHFVIKHTDNKLAGDEGGPVAPHPEEVDRVLLMKMALRAVSSENLDILTFALTGQENNIYIERIVTALAQQEDCMKQAVFVELFHTSFSKISNNKYRSLAFKNCLSAGYFKDRPAELLEKHFHEFTNQVYVCETLEFMYKSGLNDLAERYRPSLTNEIYIERLENVLTE